MNNGLKYEYVNGAEVKNFADLEEMVVFSKDERHDGFYLIYSQDFIVRYDRSNFLRYAADLKKERKTRA